MLNDRPRKLYRVEVSGTIYVMATDEWHAEDLATSAMREEKDNFEYWPSEHTKDMLVPALWADSLPWRDDDADPEVTVKQIVEAMP